MPALDATLAVRTAADVNIELAMNGPARNLDLILLVDVCLLNRAAAIWARFRERGLVGLIDLFGRRPMRLSAVILARFAAGFFGFSLGRPFGERSCLALTGAAQLVNLSAKG